MAYYILVIPEFIKNAFIVSSIGFLIVLPFYINFRLYKKAILTFFNDGITLKGRNVNIDVPIKTIDRIYCMSPQNLDGMPKEKLIVYFHQKNEKAIRVWLRHYEQVDDFIGRLLQYENVDFKTYNFDVSLDAENGE